MRRSLAWYSAPVSFVHVPSWADFITITPEHKFSVHTGDTRRTAFGPALDKATNRALDFMMGVFRDGMASARGYIERLGPYQSQLILAIPTSLVEPLKLIAVAVAGEGHWITGTVMIIAAYGCSLLFVERLFRIVRPKLLSLPWFARLWNWVLVVRGKVVGLFRPG